MILAGDIGGTKANLALFDKEVGLHNFASFPTQKAPDLKTIIMTYMHNNHITSLTHACLALPGPVENGICKTTNLPWSVERETLEKECNISNVFLLNDLEANAYATANLPAGSLALLTPGKEGKRGNRAVISPGTGLGEAGIIWDGQFYHPFACEGGHCDFAPRSELEVELYRFLSKRFDHVSYERVLSGPGLFNIYQFLHEERELEEPMWLKQMMQKEDPGRVITHHAFEGTSSLCAETLKLFVSLLGAEAGNCALKYLAFGGVFLGGGIPPKILPALKEGVFLDNFLKKGRLSNLLEKIPIWVILDEKAALKGAAYFLETKLS